MHRCGGCGLCPLSIGVLPGGEGRGRKDQSVCEGEFIALGNWVRKDVVDGNEWCVASAVQSFRRLKAVVW
jgi:hypothetical protein